MKKFKGLLISTAVLLCTATAGAFQANAGIGFWGESYGTFCSGDINLDDECTVADAVLMQRYLLGSLSGEENFILANVDLMSTADLNLDGEIDVFDFIIMRDCLVNPDSQNEISWYVDSFGYAKKEADETVGNEYVFTSCAQLEEYFDNFAYPDYTKYKETYNADFFEDNILLMKPVFEDTMNNFYSINKIFYDGDTMNIDYTYNYGGEISEESGDPVLLQVTVPKSRYHAEQISWNRKETDWIPLIEFSKKSNITREEFLDLLLSKEEFTWSDFEQYRSWETADGLEYEIDFEDDSEEVSVFLVGENRDEKPENIYLKRYSDGETVDIYELRKKILYFLASFQAPENNETNRNNVQKIADYAFSGLQNGTFDLQTVLFSEDITDNEELLNLWQESRVLYFGFVDEHTVKVVLDGGGFFDVYGYLVTDGTVEYEIGWNDNIDVDYDGGGVNIEERNGNLYFFNAGL